MACGRGRGEVLGGTASYTRDAYLFVRDFGGQENGSVWCCKRLKGEGGRESGKEDGGGEGRGGELFFFLVVFNSAGLVADGLVDLFDELLDDFRQII